MENFPKKAHKDRRQSTEGDYKTKLYNIHIFNCFIFKSTYNLTGIVSVSWGNKRETGGENGDFPSLRRRVFVCFHFLNISAWGRYHSLLILLERKKNALPQTKKMVTLMTN